MSVRMWMAAVLLLGVLVSTGGAAGDDEKEMRAAILKIADALQKGDNATAKKLADDIKSDAEEIMNLMLPRRMKDGKIAGGLGVGDKPGAITPDGIEKKVQALAKAAPTADEAKAEAKALERAGYVMQAIAISVANKVPKDKKPMPWKNYNADFGKTAKAFTDAAKTGKADAIKDAASKLNTSCINCHNDYK